MRFGIRRRGVGWRPVTVAGHRFLSKGEADRFTALAAQHPDLRVETSETSALLLCSRPGVMETFRLAGVGQNKHNAKRTVVDGITFASGHEARRYVTLRILERAGEICDLCTQVTYEFIHDGIRIGKFTPDFEYTIAVGAARGEVITEDAKSPSTKTEAYQLRKRMLWAFHRIVITEV
jgi:hypothetical protein